MDLQLITAIAEPLRCPSCRSARVSVLPAKGGDLIVRVIHTARCPTRWNPVRLRHCNDHIYGWLVNAGHGVPCYGARPPIHRFTEVT